MYRHKQRIFWNYEMTKFLIDGLLPSLGVDIVCTGTFSFSYKVVLHVATVSNLATFYTVYEEIQASQWQKLVNCPEECKTKYYLAQTVFYCNLNMAKGTIHVKQVVHVLAAILLIIQWLCFGGFIVFYCIWVKQYNLIYSNTR